jgi:hypothetical protein
MIGVCHHAQLSLVEMGSCKFLLRVASSQDYRLEPWYPACFHYLRWCLVLRNTLDPSPYTYASCIAGVTRPCHHSHVFLFMWGLVNVLPGWALKGDPLTQFPKFLELQEWAITPSHGFAIFKSSKTVFYQMTRPRHFIDSWIFATFHIIRWFCFMTLLYKSNKINSMLTMLFTIR